MALSDIPAGTELTWDYGEHYPRDWFKPPPQVAPSSVVVECKRDPAPWARKELSVSSSHPERKQASACNPSSSMASRKAPGLKSARKSAPLETLCIVELFERAASQVYSPGSFAAGGLIAMPQPMIGVRGVEDILAWPLPAAQADKYPLSRDG